MTLCPDKLQGDFYLEELLCVRTGLSTKWPVFGQARMRDNHFRVKKLKLKLKDGHLQRDCSGKQSWPRLKPGSIWPA